MSMCSILRCERKEEIWSISESRDRLEFCDADLKKITMIYRKLILGRYQGNYNELSVGFKSWSFDKVINTWPNNSDKYKCDICDRTELLWQIHTGKSNLLCEHFKDYEPIIETWCNVHLPKERLGETPTINYSGALGVGLSVIEETWTPETF